GVKVLTLPASILRWLGTLPLSHLLVLRPPRRVDHAKELEVRLSDILYALDGAGRNVNGITGAHLPRLAANLHLPPALQDVVDLGHRELVAKGGVARPDHGVGKAVAELQVRLVRVEELAKDRSVPREDLIAVLQGFHEHG